MKLGLFAVVWGQLPAPSGPIRAARRTAASVHLRRVKRQDAALWTNGRFGEAAPQRSAMKRTAG